MTKEIELVGKLRATVDDDDYWLASYRWYAHRVLGSKTVYAKAIVDGKMLYMHRVVLGDEADQHGAVVDHIDRNGLNNIRSNLRIVTLAENSRSWERDVEHIHCITARGRTYYYWNPGRGTDHAGPRVRLPSDKTSLEFIEQVRDLNKNWKTFVK